MNLKNDLFVFVKLVGPVYIYIYIYIYIYVCVCVCVCVCRHGGMRGLGGGGV